MRNGGRANHGGVLQDIANDLYLMARESMRGALLHSVRRSVDGVIERGMRIVLYYVLASVVIGLGTILLILGAYHALRAIAIPEPAACALIGLLSVAGGIILLILAPTRRDRRP